MLSRLIQQMKPFVYFCYLVPKFFFEVGSLKWRKEYTEILNNSELDELLSKIYVDDNRSVMRKIRPGLRFVEEKRQFQRRRREKMSIISANSSSTLTISGHR